MKYQIAASVTGAFGAAGAGARATGAAQSPTAWAGFQLSSLAFQTGVSGGKPVASRWRMTLSDTGPARTPFSMKYQMGGSETGTGEGAGAAAAWAAGAAEQRPKA